MVPSIKVILLFLSIKHNICNRVHSKSMSSFIHGERGCPYCSNTDLKYAENYILKYLDEKIIKYVREKTFDGLINPKTKRMYHMIMWY